MAHRLWNVPNALSISRLPLGAGLFAAISAREWWVGVLLMTIAAVTDWADGWWARKFGPLSQIGRNLDPLTDKVLVCGAFIFLLPVDLHPISRMARQRYCSKLKMVRPRVITSRIWRYGCS